MRITDISDISMPKSKIAYLKDKQNSLAIAVSLAAGLAWKDKVISFYQLIAKELLEIFDNNLLGEFLLDKFNKNYVRIFIEDKTLYFNRNNLFLNTYEQIDIKEWLKQELLILENKDLPSYITSNEKEKLFKNMTEEEIALVNKNYSKQELNSDKYMLNLVEGEETRLINTLTKADYFSLSIYEYIKLIASGSYEFNTDSEDKGRIYFKKIYNEYILELGIYVSKAIEKYIKELEKNH